MKKLMYILLLLIMAANVAAQESIVIDSVCAGAGRYYRIDGGKGYTYEWVVKDSLGIEIDKPSYTDFMVVKSPGDTTWGSEINIIWSDVGVFDLSTLVYTEHGCDTIEQGRVNVYDPPYADAGDDLAICSGQPVVLSTDTAWNYSSLLWTTMGDGTFADNTTLHPTYFPGTNDSIAQNVTLILTANGLAVNVTCDPAFDTVRVLISNPAVTLESSDLLCFNDSSGWVNTILSGGIEPYSYSWTGPGGFTADTYAIFKLTAGMYTVVITDSVGCTVTDSIKIKEPLELLANAAADTTEICDDGIVYLIAKAEGGTGAYTNLWTGTGAPYLSATDALTPFFTGALPGNYSLIYTVTDFNDCVASDTIEITVLPKDTISVDTVICSNEVPFVWYGKDYFTTDIYYDTLESTIVCDTILILDLTVLPLDTITFDTMVCGNEVPLAMYGKDYFTTGIYMDTLESVFGCDTIVIIDLEVLPIDTTTFDTIICGLDAPYVWNGADYFVTGTYLDTTTASTGCDSILILNLTVLPIDTLQIDTAVCGNEVPFAFNGKDYFLTDIYIDTLISATGCDSIIRLDLTILPIDTLTFDTTICGLDAPYAWNGFDYFTSGTYVDTIEASTGCDSILILNLVVLPIDTLNVDTTICEDATPFAINGKDYFISGTYIDTLYSATGCDSILMLDLIVLPKDTITFDTIICGLDAPFAWYGKDYFTTDIYTDTLPSPFGCDTILILDLTVLPIDTLSVKRLICANDLPYNWNSNNYFTTGIYIDTFYSATGCDSILLLDLTVIPIDTVNWTATICGLDAPLTWNGKDYFVTGNYMDTLTASTTCDSIVILELTVLPIDTLFVDTIICITDTPFAFNGHDYYTTNIYTDTLISANGCDSILVLDLTVMPIDTIPIDTAICIDEVPFALYGKEYFTTDIYTDTLPALIGCDTIVILNLTILPIDTLKIDTIICGLDAPFVWNGLNYYETNIYIDTLIASTGCDSILILDLTVLPIDTLKLDTIICGNEVPFAWYGRDYFTTDIYIDTLFSATGCDSILRLDLTILPIDTVTFDTTICGLDAPYAWNGSDYFVTGTYMDTLTASTTCDSIVILNLTVLPIDTLNIDTIICITDAPFTYAGVDYFTTNIYIDTLISATGCDSILVLDLTVMPIDTIALDTIICVNETPFAWYGKDYFTTGIYYDSLPALIGCDTILVLDLTVLPVDTTRTDTTICGLDAPFVWNGLNYYETDIYIDTVIASTGCDSILILDLTVLPIDTLKLDTIICGNEIPFAWNGHDYYTAGIFIDTLVSNTGCDSIAIINLNIIPIDTIKVDTIICSTEVPFNWYGKNYFKTDIYTDTLVTANACDTILILDLTIIKVDTILIQQTICENEAPILYRGRYYFNTGIYRDSIPAPFGCDTLILVDLTVNPLDSLTIDTTLCENSPVFAWNSHTIGTTRDSSYVEVLDNVWGCDSTVRLNVTIIPSSTTVTDTILAKNSPSFVWNGLTILTNNDSIYQNVQTNVDGCDSILILNVTILPISTTITDTTICEDIPPFVWNGQNIVTDRDSSYTVIYKDISGFDSTLVLNVNVIPVMPPLTIDSTLCLGTTSFTWNGHTIFTDRDSTYQATLTNSGGCDSIVTLNIKILPTSITVQDTIIVQNSPTFVWNGQTIQTDNDSIYQVVLTNIFGCDSIVNIDVKVIPENTTVTDTTICEDIPPFVWNGQNIVTDRDSSYTVIYKDVSGLDSTLILNVNVIPVMPPLTIDSTLCLGTTSFTWNGHTILSDRDSTYQATLTNSGGCDSIVTLNIKILPTSITVQDTIIVQNSPTFVWNGQTIQTDNDSIYQVVLTNIFGCDSIVTIDVKVIPENTTVTDTTICVDSPPFVWNGQNIVTDRDSSYTVIYKDVSGLDSTLILNVNVIPILPPLEIDSTLCLGTTSFTWNGHTIFTDRDSTYQATLTNSGGCDSIVTLNIKILPTSITVLDTIIVQGSPDFVWNGQPIETDNDSIYQLVLTNIFGCDSIVTIDVKVVPVTTTVTDTTICVDSPPFVWNGQDIVTDRDSTYIVIYPDISGFDSTLILNVNVIPLISVAIDTLLCEGTATYDWNGQTIFTDFSRVYSDTLTASGGCDSVVVYTVNVIPATTSVTDTTISDVELPFVWNGVTYNVPGTYNITLTNAAGCDSLLTLNLNVIYSPNVVNTMVCIQDLPVIWNGDFFFTEGIHSVTLTSVITGKDSIVKLNIIFEPEIEPIFEPLGPYCQYEKADPLPLVSLNGITGKWSQKKISTDYYGIMLLIFTPDPGQCAKNTTMEITVFEEIIPEFDSIGPFCEFSIPPALPLISNNGIAGTWSPSIIGTNTLSLVTYTFTPDTGRCIKPFKTIIQILPETAPVFDQLGPYCQNSVADTLPLISTNGIRGTWEPALISTENAGKFLYVFTPDSNQCSVADTMEIEILPELTPQFDPMGPYCQFGVADILPLISNNGITGTWNPAVINTTVVGFADYTFTPDPGQCAVDTTITIEITDQIKPVFTAPGPFCQFSIPPVLPLVSENKITGIWNPAVINTSVAGTGMYIFTPDTGQCAVPDTIYIEILPEITPVFDQLGPYCQNSVADMLPLMSNNGVYGTWKPDTIDTKTYGTFMFTFTPDSGQCAVPVTMSIEIIPEVVPVFVQLGPLCQNSPAPALPAVSVNGIGGTWSPAVIDTKVAGTFMYMFTPAGGLCAIPTTMLIEITPEITPEFDQIGPLCQNSLAPVLPLISNNSIAGTWNPTTIDTKTMGATTYTFTPAPVYCAVPVTMVIEITEVLTPVFAAFDVICPNSVAPVLPTVSENGVSGTWSPAVIETSVQGLFTFTFTPDAGQCAVGTTLNIEVSDIIPPVAICRNITVYLDADGNASVTTAQIDNNSYDNCELDTLYLSRYDFNCDDIGKNPVTLYAIDGVGLTDDCEAIVTVLDTISPTVICRGPFEIQLDENAEYKLTVAEVLENANDVCGIDTMYVYPHALDCDHIGLTIITLYVEDVNGNSSYCETEVMIYGNRPPNVLDDSTRTLENTPVVIDVISNDFDEKTNIDISTLAVTIKPLHGIVSINPVNGDFTYIPDLNFSGVDVLEYRICDDGIPCEPECGKAYVYITVEPVNDKPIAIDDYYNAGCFSVTRNVMDNDRDPDSDNLTINTIPLYPTNHGQLIIDPDGTINYFPDEGFVGIDSFDYVICDNGIPSLCDTARVYIEVDCNEETQNPLECELFIPEGFSPNEDGIHDFFRIMCIHNYPDAKLMIFNRNGDLLWEKEHYGNYDVWGDQYNAWWWGTSILSKYDVGMQTILGDPKLKVGNYVYVLLLGNGEVRNGTVMISY